MRAGARTRVCRDRDLCAAAVVLLSPRTTTSSRRVAKFRAARRLWARHDAGALRRFRGERRSLRFHTQTGRRDVAGAATPQQCRPGRPFRRSSATLGGTQSLHTNGYDEALALPTAEAATLALRTQQIIANESGLALTVDPLAGSYYVEHLTNELEAKALELLAKVDALGGAAKAIEASFFQEEIARSAYEFQMRVERGEDVIVGVNRYSDGQAPPVIPTPDFSALEREQVGKLEATRAARDGERAAAAMDALRGACASFAQAGVAREPLMVYIIEAVRARVSVGEVADVMRGVWGEYRPA